MIKAKWVGKGPSPEHNREAFTRAHVDDAAFDLYVSERRVIYSGEFADVPSGVAVELPAGCWAMLVGRSSTLRRRGLFVVTGIIDPGYRGELFSGVQNVGRSVQTLEPGERISQLILFRNETYEHGVEWVQELSPSNRGTHGFGSSGV